MLVREKWNCKEMESEGELTVAHNSMTPSIAQGKRESSGFVDWSAVALK